MIETVQHNWVEPFDYAELLNLTPTTLYDECGSVHVLIQVTESHELPSSRHPDNIPENGFGTEGPPPYGDQSRQHSLVNYVVETGDWMPVEIFATVQYTLKLRCGEDPVLEAAPQTTGDWSLSSVG